jgi:dTDP-4-amino-4,6-dideoxygalactose transaminase
MFPIRVHERAGATRDDVIKALAADGIGSSVHYRPLHQMVYWKDRYPSKPGEFAVADRYFAGAVTLPLFPGMSDAEVDRVVQAVRRILK